MEQTTKVKLLAFVMLKLAKNSKSLEKNVKNVENIEIPYLSLIDNNGQTQVISYSEDMWSLLNVETEITEIFNPTPTELNDFCENYSYESIDQAIKTWSLHTTNVFAKYGVQIPD